MTNASKSEKNRRDADRRAVERRNIDPPPLLKWSERFSTGIRAIDNDHKGLFEEIALLRDEFSGHPDQRTIASVIDGLKLYVSEHFAREEMFMEKANFPDIEAHKKAHRQVTLYVHELEQLYSEDPRQIDGGKVVNFLSRWLSSHILGFDMKYIPYLLGGTRADQGDEETVELEMQTVEMRLPADKAQAVRAFARILREGGHVADALLEAIGQFADKREAVTRDAAIKLFCKDA